MVTTSQAILLDKASSKGHFRRALVYTEKLKGELEKEKRGEFWILDKGFEYAREAEKSLHRAAELMGVDLADPKVAHAAANLKRSNVSRVVSCLVFAAEVVLTL